MTNTEQLAQALRDQINAMPSALIHKWQVLEVINEAFAQHSAEQAVGVVAATLTISVEGSTTTIDCDWGDAVRSMPPGSYPLFLAAPEAPASTAAAMQIVIDAMRADPDYAWSWHCNVAMSFVDAGGDRYTANQGAARFMRLLANVDPAHELPTEAPASAQQAEDAKDAARLDWIDKNVCDVSRLSGQRLRISWWNGVGQVFIGEGHHKDWREAIDDARAQHGGPAA